MDEPNRAAAVDNGQRYWVVCVILECLRFVFQISWTVIWTIVTR